MSAHNPYVHSASVAIALLLSGCGEAQPEFAELQPVSGVIQQGDKPVAGGAVQFVPVPDQPGFLINSEVGADGHFTLTTVRTTDATGERRPGAPAGEYRVTYSAPMLDQTANFVPPVELAQPITIATGPNNLTINLPGKR